MNRWLLRRQQTTLSSSSSFTTAASSSSSSHDALFDRMTQLLQHNCRLVVAVAGGGTHFASTLAATPGASQVLLEAVTLYDREAFCAFVGSTTTTTHINKFASMPAAQKAATAALQRALQWTVGPTTCARSNYSSLQQMPCTVGLACASQLNSNHTTTSTTSNSSSSQAFVVAQLPQGSVVQMKCTIPSCLHRREQDVQVAHAMLTCLEYALQLREDAYNNNNNNNSQDSYATLWKQRLENVSVTTIHASLLEWTETITDTGEQRHVQITVPGCPVIDAARAILQQQQQQEKVMLLIPQQQQQQFKVIQGSVATLPPHSLIVPGSFNPPHIGHVQLALAALQAMPTAINPVIWFELSLTNADKPSLQPEAAVERVLQFFELAPQLQSCQWGVLLTNAPLFAQKVDLLQPMTASTQLTFCIGTDTLVRLLDPKYYQNSRDTMIATLEQLPCHFVAGGRVNSQNVFVTGEAALAELPRHVAAKFTLLPEFRVDISSTELREQTKKSN